MLWFKEKKHPDFWNSYLEHFKNPQNTDLETLRFVVLDTETTGLNPKVDRILSIGTVAIEHKVIKISDSLECYLSQDFFNHESVKIHGLLKTGHHEKMNEKDAIALFLNHIKNAVLIAHHAAFDIAMIQAALKRLGLGKLKNRVLDLGHVYKIAEINRPLKTHVSLDELAEQFNIPQHDRHTASGDAYITALLFLKIIAKYQQKKDINLYDLQSPVLRIGLL